MISRFMDRTVIWRRTEESLGNLKRCGHSLPYIAFGKKKTFLTLNLGKRVRNGFVRLELNRLARIRAAIAYGLRIDKKVIGERNVLIFDLA